MVAQKVKNLPAVQETWVRKDPWVRKMPWRRECLPSLVFLPENSMDKGAGVAKSWT